MKHPEISGDILRNTTEDWHMKRLNRLFFIYSLLPFALYAGTFSDNHIGYTVTLPDNWIQDQKSDTMHSFFDSTGKYQALIGIYFTDFSADTLYSTPDEWSRTRLITTELIYRSRLATAIVLFDSISTRQNGLYWAPELYAYHYESDTSAFPNWADYVRFTAIGKTGYEIYAVSTIPDLDSNIAYYAALLDGFQIRGMNASIQQPPKNRVHAGLLPSSKFQTGRYDLLGRRSNAPIEMPAASQLLIRRCAKSCVIR
jgi:hypothetical protein